MLHPRVKYTGAHVHKNVLKAGIALFPREGGLSYPLHYVSKPVIPESGYPGGVDEQGCHLDADNHKAWLRSLPVKMELNPCLVHFIRINPGTTRRQLEREIQRIFSPDVLATIDTLLSDRSPSERESISSFRKLMNSSERRGNGLILPGGYDEELLLAEANNIFSGLAGELDGGGTLLDIQPGTIDIGPGATDRSATLSWGNYTAIDQDNPANDTGTIDTFELWFNTAGANVKVGTFYGSGTTRTSRDSESIGSVTSGSKQTFSGLDCDVVTDDLVGIYLTSGNLEGSTIGGTGNYYKYGDQFGAGSQTYSAAAGYVFSIYGTGASAPTEKSGSDSGTGAENADLETSGVLSDDDTGTGTDAKISFPTASLSGSESGLGAESAGINAGIITGEVGAGSDYSVSSSQVPASDSDGGSGSDATKALIAKAGSGSEMNLPGNRGQTRMPSRGVNL